MQNFVILYALINIIKAQIEIEQTSDKRNYGELERVDMSSVKVLQLKDKRIILTRYDNQGYLGTFTEKEGFSLKKSDFPYSITAVLLKHGEDFAIADNSFLKKDGNKGSYVSEYTIFDSETLEKKSSFTFKAKSSHDALNNFRIFSINSTIVQVYAELDSFCFTSTEFRSCIHQEGTVAGLECILIEDNTKFLCLYSLEMEKTKGVMTYSNIASSVVLNLTSGDYEITMLKNNSFFSVFEEYAPYLIVSKGIQLRKGVFSFLFRTNKNRHCRFFNLIIEYQVISFNILEEIDSGFNYPYALPSLYSIMPLSGEKLTFLLSFMSTLYLGIIKRQEGSIDDVYYYSFESYSYSPQFFTTSADFLLNENKEIEIFTANNEGVNFLKYNLNNLTFCKGYEYFVNINSSFDFEFNFIFNSIEKPKPIEVVFYDLPKEGLINVINKTSGNKPAETLKNYPEGTKFQYISSNNSGNFSLKYEGRQQNPSINMSYCHVVFHVVNCSEMCKSCTYGGTSKDHRCSECADNYYRKEIDEYKENCYKDPTDYYLDSTEKIYRKCGEGCQTCLKGPKKDKDNCEVCKEDFYYYKKEKKCLKDCPSSFKNVDIVCIKDCKTREQYLLVEKENSSCTKDLPLGYYEGENEIFNIARKCKYNCGIANNQNEDFKLFCEKRKKQCPQKIPIDENITLNYFGINDNATRLALYIEMSGTMKKETLNRQVRDILYSKDNITLYLISDIYLAGKMIEASSELSNKDKKDIFERLIKEISKILTCEKLEEFFIREKDQAVLSTALTIYSLLSSRQFISTEELSALTLLEKCIIQKGTPQLFEDTDTDEISQEDFLVISGTAVTKMNSILNEITKNEDSIDPKQFNNSLRYQFNNSIISSSIRSNIKQLVDNTSKMLSQLQGTAQNFTFGETTFISAKLENLNDKNYVLGDIMITVSDCSNIASDLDVLKKQKLKAKVCIPSEALFTSFEYPLSVSIVDYAEYPLLNQNITTKISKNFISIDLRNKEHETVRVKDLNESFHIILKKPEKSLNECLFLNEDYYSLDNTNCTSVNIDDEYIECICNHLTDFSISSFNPVTLFKDIFRLFQQSRIINSFKPFKNLTYKNAFVLYTIGVILVIFSILLFFTLRYDLKKGSFFVVIVEKKKKCCSSRNEVYEEINELEKKYKNSIDSSQKEIELSDLSTQESAKNINYNLSIDNSCCTVDKSSELIKEKKKKSSCLCEYINEYWFLFKDFFLEEFWFCCIFFDYESELTKTNFLVIFIVKFISTLSIATIFTECGEPEEVAASYTNRDLAVAVITILINEIPFIIFELMLARTQLFSKMSSRYYPCRANTIYRHTFVYIILGAIVIFGTLNTTWVSLDSETNGLNCRFMTDFFLTVVIDCFIYQTIQLIVKALIYFFILNGEKSSCLRGTLLFIVSLVPWIFNLYG